MSKQVRQVTLALVAVFSTTVGASAFAEDKPTEAEREAFRSEIQPAEAVAELQAFIEEVLSRDNASVQRAEVTEDAIVAMRAKRAQALQVLEAADKNVAAAIKAAQDAAKKNNRPDALGEALSIVSKFVNFYQKAEAGWAALEVDKGGSKDAAEELDRIRKAPLLSEAKTKLAEQNGGQSVYTGIQSTEIALAASYEPLNGFLQEVPSNRIDVAKALSDDISWLEKNPMPDWSKEPALELIEGEMRIARASKAIMFLDGLDPTKGEEFAELHKWSEEDFAEAILDGGIEAWLEKQPNFVTALEILFRPQVISDGGIGTRDFTEVQRDKLYPIAENYWLWRTRKPSVSIKDFGEVDIEKIQETLDCTDGCVGVPK